jgi:cytochrome P450
LETLVIPTPSDSGTETDLPVIPATRAVDCPLKPPAEFVAWRDEPGLRRAMYQGKPTWIVSRYQEIRAALVDPRLSAKTIPETVTPSGTEDNIPIMFARVDDPEHHRLRRMLTSRFTFRRAEAMRPQIQALVDFYLDRMIAGGSPADLVRDYALPVPSLVISLMLGVPSEDLAMFQHHTSVGLDQRSSDEVKAGAFGAMYMYIVDLVDRKERDPGDDLISHLVAEYIATGQLNKATAAMTAVIMMQAGHETTANMIALGTVALLEHRDVYERLGKTEDLAEVANLVEELMRYLSIVHSQVDRVATEDMTFAGESIKAGDFLLMNLPAGNWDPEFVENPEAFDIHRNARGHLAFGYGVHQCIGANLARVEMQIAFSTLARRLPGLELSLAPEQMKFKESSGIYGMQELPVSW